MQTNLENAIIAKIGKDQFEKHYEKKCYYLMFKPEGADREVHETYWVSSEYPPLKCLKMAYQLGETLGTNYRILLSDEETEVDSEILAFAISQE